MIDALWAHKNTVLVVALLALTCIAGFAPPETKVVGAVGTKCQTVMRQDRGDVGAWPGTHVMKEALTEGSVCGGGSKVGDRFSSGDGETQQRDRIIAGR